MIIDKEFQKIIPELTPEEFTQLKENILKEGCRDALVVWNDTLVDGHNRYKICTENNIAFTTKEIEFENRSEAIEWIINNQLGRRNLAPYVKLELVERLEASIRARARKNQLSSLKQNTTVSAISSKRRQPIDTRKELAKLAGVGEGTVNQFKAIQREGTEEQKERARKGGKGNTLNAIYGEIEQEKIKNKTCIHCNKTMESEKFLPGKNVCRECDNRLRVKSTADKMSQEPKEEQPKAKPKRTRKNPFDMDLYDLSNVPEYTIDDVLIEIEGSRENLIYVVDNCLEERDELIHKAENAAIFNNKINQIISELKERLIDEE